MYTITAAKEQLKNGIREYLYKNADGEYVIEEKNRQPMYLEGPPGIGKTEIVKQVSKELGIGYVGASLVHMTRNTLLGLPIIKELEDGRQYTVYTVPEIIANVYHQVEKGYKEGILLLDEFPCTSDIIMPTMLGFLQTKNIGIHTLPEGWLIVLCGNPPEYNRFAKKFDSTILDRIRRLPITFDGVEFIKYGRKIGLEARITDYLEIQPSHIYHYYENNNEVEMVTCRSWENLSHAICIYTKLGQGIDLGLIKQFIKSDQISNDFLSYLRQCEVGLSRTEIDEILEGRNFEKHYNKIKELSFQQQLLLCNYLCERITTRQIPEELVERKYKEMGRWLDHTLDLLMEVDEKGILAERAYINIHKNEILVKVIRSVKCRVYLNLSQKMIGSEPCSGERKVLW